MKIIKYIFSGILLCMLCSCQHSMELAQDENIKIFSYKEYDYTSSNDLVLWQKSTQAEPDEAFQLNFADSIQPKELVKIKDMIRYVNSHSGMNARLVGYTNVKGSKAYNNALLWAKMREIVSYLEQGGIDYTRTAIVSSDERKPKIKGHKEYLIEVFYLEAQYE